MRILNTLLLLVSLPVIAAPLARAAEPIEFGVMLCQTGNCADWGTAALKGAELAKERINAAGGVSSRPLSFIIEDTAESTSGAQAVTAFRSLQQRGLKFYIGPSWSPAALSISPIAAKDRGIIVITPSASDRSFSRSAPHLFNIRPAEELATRALARVAFKRAGRRAAIFSSQQPAESTQGQIFEDEFRRLGGEVTVRIEGLPTESDLTSHALRILKSKPDAVFLMNYNQLETGAKSLRALGYRGLRLAISLDDARIANSEGLLEGVVVARAAQPTVEFQDAFRERYNEPPGLSAENGYDAVMALAQSIREAGTDDINAIRDKLQNANFTGAIGEFTFGEHREVVQEPELLVVVEGRLRSLRMLDQSK